MIISPAKRLDFESPLACAEYSQPVFLERSKILIERLRALSPAEIASLMGVSDALALLNFHRFADWRPPFAPDNARQALLAFDGDVYAGLQARQMSADDLAFAQRHLRILSGLYGVLRPLDLIQPYRLEMGIRLENPEGKDLYAFWETGITAAIADELAAMPRPVLVNLASQEYFKVLQGRRLPGRIITPVFEDWKEGRFRMISLYAKRARGLMARYAILRRLNEPEELQAFAEEGYAFVPAASDEHRWVFRR